MLTSSTKKKILVCTPSNAAIDEVVLRLASETNPFGQVDQMKKLVLRIGAMEYEPLEQVKKSTLDWKLDLEIQKFLYGHVRVENE